MLTLKEPHPVQRSSSSVQALVRRRPVTPGAAGHFGLTCMPGSYRRTKAGTGRTIAALEKILTQCPGEKTWPTARHGSDVCRYRWHDGQW